VKFHFTLRYSNDGIKHVLLVDVVFTNPKNGNRITVQCRIDSEANELVLPVEVGIMLGLKLESGESLEFQGITHDPVDGYRHTIEMRIKNDPHYYKVPCSFVFDLRSTGLLGIRGFFENYKVSFDIPQKFFELKPKSEPATKKRHII
jgi:hypothetical protein